MPRYRGRGGGGNKRVQKWYNRVVGRFERPITAAITIPLIGFGAAALLAARSVLVDKPVDALLDKFNVAPDDNRLPDLQQYVLQGQDINKPPKGYVFVPYPEEHHDFSLDRGPPRSGSRTPVLSPKLLNHLQHFDEVMTPSQLQDEITKYYAE